MKPFIRTKVIKGHEYLYEITPYFDPESGKWKQKTRYLGKNIGGEPVKKGKSEKPSQVFDLGQYIPAYWAVHEYKILEALLSGCSPTEAATIVILAINRLIQPGPPTQLETWFSGTFISHLIPGSSLASDEIHQILQNVSDDPVAEMFTRMFSLVNQFSDQRVLLTLQSSSSSLKSDDFASSPLEDRLERDLVMRIHYDPSTRVPAGCDLFQFQRQVIDDSINQVTSGHIPGGIIVPHWDYMTSSLLPKLVRSGCPFIVRTDLSYKPVASHISASGEQMYHPANIRHYQGQACYIRPFSPVIGGIPLKGYILHNIRKEQADRVFFHKNIQNIRELITEISTDGEVDEELLDQTSGPFRSFFIHEEHAGISLIRKDEDAISRVLPQFGRDGVLYLGDFSWEECFNLVDLRKSLENEMNLYITQFERDYSAFRIDRIRRGIYFVSYLAVLIRHLIENRLKSAKIPGISSLEGLLAELTPIHVVKSHQLSVVPQHLKREQKTILSFFGGLPRMITE